MKLFDQPMSQEQKRLRLREAMKLLMEGEDFDYVRMRLREIFPANLNQRELKEIALKIAMLPADERDALIQDIMPSRFDNRHFHTAILEKKHQANLAALKAQNKKATSDFRAEKLERSRAAWKRRIDKIKFWFSVIFWGTGCTLLIYAIFVVS